MPNHVYNKLIGPKAILEKFITKGEFDFNKIKRIPKEARDAEVSWSVSSCLKQLNKTQRQKIILELEANDFFVTATEKIKLKKEERKSCLNFLKYNTMSQYDWQVKNWGTKWNAYDQSIRDLETGELELEFNTAWSPPEALMLLLSKKAKTELHYEFIEEQGAAYLGWQKLKNGVKIDSYEPDPWSKEAYELMFEWWGNSSEYEWNKEKGSYQYVDDDE